MFKKLTSLIKTNQEEDASSKIINKPTTYEEAESFVREKIFNKNAESQQMIELVNEATAGCPSCRKKLTDMILDILISENITIEGYSTNELAEKIYANNWGLDERLQPFYDDSTVSELRVNDTEVFIKRNGKNEKTGITFPDRTAVKNLITRLIQHDFGVALNTSNPIAESMRRDNTRITAICFPVVGGTQNDPGYTLILRKHTFEISPENYEKSGTMSKRVWNAIKLLYRGGANILFSGNPGSGKTTMVRALVGTLPTMLRIVSIESDRELFLEQHYPFMDITSLEEHQVLGVDMNELFRAVLRLSPDVIIVGEFRGSGEVMAAVDAFSRGSKRAMATAHFNSPYEALEGTGLLMLREKLNLDLESAKLMVANAFNIIVQLRGDSERGIIKLESVSQLYVKNGKPQIKPLIKWEPYTKDYMGDGEWKFVNMPHESLIKELYKNGVSREDVIDIWKN